MKRLLRVMAIAAVVGAIIGWAAPVEADHLVYLPYVPQTPLMQQVIAQQEYAWCADSRATNYPNFVNQIKDVQDQYTERVGIRHRQVAFNDPACQVKHTMPDVVDCSGCAAYIFYANSPVVIVYKWALGYFDWGSAIGHELGHGLLGLHEQYRDSGGSIGCVFRSDTVMSCGPPYVKYPQALDVSRGCAIIRTGWCGVQPDPCDGPYDAFGNKWNPCLGRWVRPSGWLYDPATGNEHLPTGELEYLACNQDSIRWNLYISAFLPPFSGYFRPERGFWSFSPPC